MISEDCKAAADITAMCPIQGRPFLSPFYMKIFLEHLAGIFEHKHVDTPGKIMLTDLYDTYQFLTYLLISSHS